MGLKHLTPAERARLRASTGRVGAEAAFWAELLATARAETAEVQRRFDRYEEKTDRELSRAKRPGRIRDRIRAGVGDPHDAILADIENHTSLGD